MMYSIKLPSSPISEYDDFGERLTLRGETVRLNEIDELLKRIVNSRYGADIRYFKDENAAQAIPKFNSVWGVSETVAKPLDFGLRLYCLRISHNAVVLFNGDVKTVAGAAQMCPNCKAHIASAIRYARGITNAIGDGTIEVDHSTGILDFDNPDAEIEIN